MDTNTLHQFIFFLTALSCGAGQFLDCHTTDVALAHGFTEVNALAIKIYNKIGATGFFLLKCMAIPGIGAAIMAKFGFGPSMAWLVPLTAVGFYAGISNYRGLKKKNIPLF